MPSIEYLMMMMMNKSRFLLLDLQLHVDSEIQVWEPAYHLSTRRTYQYTVALTQESLRIDQRTPSIWALASNTG